VKSSSGFRGVRLRQSDRWAADLHNDGERMQIGTFHTPEEGAHAYDTVACRCGLPRQS
jgi:hypothetical protein